MSLRSLSGQSDDDAAAREPRLRAGSTWAHRTSVVRIATRARSIRSSRSSRDHPRRGADARGDTRRPDGLAHSLLLGAAQDSRRGRPRRGEHFWNPRRRCLGHDPAGTRVDVHLSTRLPAGLWTTRAAVGGTIPCSMLEPGEVIDLDGGARVELLDRVFLDTHEECRLWWPLFVRRDQSPSYLAVHGRPITYGYVQGSLADHHVPERLCDRARFRRDAERRTALHPGDHHPARREGIGVVPVVLHTGVASLEASEPPYPEPFRVSGSHRASGQRHPQKRREGDRCRHHGRPCARDGRRRAGTICTPAVVGPRPW